MSTLVLYDLPSRSPCGSWSLNPWKTRLVLNYKNIDYKTEWVEYPDVAPTLKQFGIPPNKEGTQYTIPTVRMDDGRYVMDSRAIAAALEERYPEPSLHLDDEILPGVEALMPKIMTALAPVVMPMCPRNLLNESSAEYFEKTRSERFGMPLAQFGREKGGKHAWDAAEPSLREMEDLLKEKNEGPFFLGETVSYADFVFVGFLQFVKRAGQGIYEIVAKGHPSFAILYDASMAWLKRDSY